MSSVRAVARERDLLRHAALGALLFVGLPLLTHRSLLTFAPAFGVALGWELFSVAADAYALPAWTKPTVIGVFLVGASAYWLAVTDGTPWLGALTLLFGGWLVADGYATYRNGPVERPSAPYFRGLDGRPGEAFYRMQEAGRVARALREEPRTRDRLAADLGLTESHVEEVLDALETRGIASETDGVYRASPSRFRKRAVVVRLLRWLPRRLLRPLR